MRAGLLLSILAAVAWAGQAAAQAPPDPDLGKPDWARARTHVTTATRLAGKSWAAEVAYFCYPGARTNRVTDPPVEPMKLFDNLYAVGDDATVVYILDTPDGLILIDALYPEKLLTVLLPGMARLGLDPARVKLVLITHGHADHYGGAAYFQAEYGAKVGIAAADWDAVTKAAPTLRKALVLEDGKAVSLGGLEVTPVETPGHTPGSLGFIFPVRDGAAVHMAGLFGSSILTSVRPNVKLLKTHLGAIRRFRDKALQMKVDVELQNHPLFDGMWDKAAALKVRAPGAAHPFVVGGPAYGRFMDVMAECLGATLARKGALRD